MNTRRYASPLVNVRLRIPLGLLAVGLAFFDLLAVFNARPSTTNRVQATIPIDVREAPNATADIVGRALALASSLIGSTAFDEPTQICDRFVARVYGYHASGEDSAYVHYVDLRNRGLIHATPHPPAGALVFFGPAQPNGFYGHVMVSRGDDTAYSNAVTGGIGITTIDFMTRNSGPYLGWADGPTGFPRGV
jgi:hypothetical protein